MAGACCDLVLSDCDRACVNAFLDKLRFYMDDAAAWSKEKMMFGLETKDFIPIVISVIALILTILQYFGEYRRKKKQDTLEAYNDLQGKVFTKLNELRKEYPVVIADRSFAKRAEITEYLARIERFCVGVNLGIYDFKTLKRCGGAYFVRLFFYLKPVILDKRNRNDGGSHYDEFERVAMKMKREYERRSGPIDWNGIPKEELQETDNEGTA